MGKFTIRQTIDGNEFYVESDETMLRFIVQNLKDFFHSDKPIKIQHAGSKHFIYLDQNSLSLILEHYAYME